MKKQNKKISGGEIKICMCTNFRFEKTPSVDRCSRALSGKVLNQETATLLGVISCELWPYVKRI